MSFVVDKWYLDLVTGDGVALVAYLLEVRWLGFELRAASRLVAAPGVWPDERSAVGEALVPALTDGRVVWSPQTLDLQATWHAIDPPIDCTLLDTPAGRIEWSCVMPRARVHAVVDGRSYEGLGYAERLRLTLPPWAFPFRTLRWGRHVSDAHALVWIEWDGERRQRLAWLDGSLQPQARIVPAGVDGLTGGHALRWRQGHDVTRRRVGDIVGRVAPALGAMVAGRLAGMQEHKQCARAAIVDADGHAIDDGWAIHEVVTW